MLPGLGFSEVLVLAVIALLVVGPKDLPLMLRKLGRWLAQLRGMAQEFRTGFDELARQAELDELKREVEALRNASQRGVAGLVDELSRPVDMTPIPTAAPRPQTPPAQIAAPPPAADPVDDFLGLGDAGDEGAELEPAARAKPVAPTQVEPVPATQGPKP
jgi:sec-independent protein translocase protein TatB